jgi:hypothetical protein
MKTTPTKLKLKTIKRIDVCNMAFCNSPKLPKTVVDDGVVKKYVGIGWINLDRPPQKGDVEIID